MRSQKTRTVMAVADLDNGIAIRFAVGACSLGYVLVAASSRGIRALFLGSDPEALVLELRNRFRNSRIIPGDRAVDSMLAIAIGLVERPSTDFTVPLDLRGTAFQLRVWEMLRQIPPGSTVTYKEIAKRIGQPTATRAVAQACAANPIAIAIPCHRVLRSDETLSGYRWGVERKAELLERERCSI